MTDPPYIKYVSPTALNLYETNKKRFILQYIKGSPRPAQTEPMAVGSGFDARIKGRIEADLLGVPNRWEQLFEKQVDLKLRPQILIISEKVVTDYVKSNAYKSLLAELANSIELKFEFDAARTITVEIDGVTLEVPLFGKPDLSARKENINLIYDWKVNGFYSIGSAAAGYIRYYSPAGFETGWHKDAFKYKEHDIEYNIVDQLRPEWKAQLWFYTAMVEDHGNPWIVGIDQLLYAKSEFKGTAVHRCKIAPHFCTDMQQRVAKMWRELLSGEIMKDIEEIKFTVNTDSRRSAIFSMPF